MYDIKIKDLSVYYSNVCALKNINLNVKSKEFLGIVGPNGGGKTTLLKVILGLIKPDSGAVFIRKDASMGYVPQFSFFDRDFPISVLDVILMGKLAGKAKLFQRFSVSDREAAYEIMNKMGIFHLKDRQIGKLSGGQLQKVLIARTLISKPDILILDEPTANIDVESKRDIYKMLSDINERMTILLVSHELNDLFSYIDSVAYVNKTIHYHKAEYEFYEEGRSCPINLFMETEILRKEMKSYGGE